jgi:hypothetical protein
MLYRFVTALLVLSLATIAQAQLPEKPPEKKRPALLQRLKIGVQTDSSDAVGAADSLDLVRPEGLGSFDDPDTKKRGEWLIVPIPFSNPTIGSGLTGVVAYLFPFDPEDTKSPMSTVGGGAMGSNNGSRGAALGGKLYLKEDRWRVGAFVGGVDINYDFYGIGRDAGNRGRAIPIKQEGVGGQVEVLREIFENIYIGGAYTYMATDSSLQLSDLVGALRPRIRVGTPDPRRFVRSWLLDGRLSLELDIAAMGLRFLWDSIDNQFYPTQGHYLDVEANLYAEAFGSDAEYQTYQLAYNYYRPTSSRGVLAVRGFARTTGGNAPFFALSTFGANSDLRGYEAGRYRDKSMWAAQAEYRHKWSKRWGYVAFAGVGGVGPSFSELFDEPLPSFGGGLRYQVTKDNPIHMRLDIAVGKDDAKVYFSVGEAF